MNSRFGFMSSLLLLAALAYGTSSAAGDAKNESGLPAAGMQVFDPALLMEDLKTRIDADRFRFVVLGDSKNAKTLPALLKYLDETINPDFVLTTGDMVPSGGGTVGAGYYEMLATAAGPAMRKRPWWPAIGNHELAGSPITGKDALKDDSEQLRKNQRTGEENFKTFYKLADDHYSFSFRHCTFIALPFKYPAGKQLEWLVGELKSAATAKQHIILFNHVPFFTVGAKSAGEIPNTETTLTALFQRYGVQAVFSGHDHGYYRTVRSGIPYFISAGGGAPIYPGLRVKEARPEDVYYFGLPESFKNGAKNARYVLHKADGTETFSEKPTQFFCVVDVDGPKLTCFTTAVNGDKWDEIVLSN